MARKHAVRKMPLDLDEILGDSKSKEPVVTTSVRLPASMATQLKGIAKSRRMSVTKLLRNLISALIRDYENHPSSKKKS